MEIIRLVWINLLITVVLVIVLNIASAYVLKHRNDIQLALSSKPSESTAVLKPGDVYADNPIDVDGINRWRLPNYEGNRNQAYAMMSEFEHLSSRYEPFVGWARKATKGQTVTINEKGVRTHEQVSTQEYPKIARFFGASVLWGTGSVDNDTIPAQFDRINNDYIAYNYGESALLARQNLGQLINLLSLGEKADLVVFYIGSTNMGNGCADAQGLPYHFQRQFEIDGLIRKSSLEGSPLYNLFFGYTAELLKKLAGKKISSHKKPESLWGTDPKQAAKNCADRLFANLEMARVLTQNNGGRFYAIVHPSTYYASPRVDYLPPSAYTREDKKTSIAGFYDEVLGRRDLYPYILDFTSAFDGDEYIFIDEAHTSANGNAIIAEKFNTFLKEKSF